MNALIDDSDKMGGHDRIELIPPLLRSNPLTLQQRAPAFEPDGSGDPYTLTGDTVRVPFEDAIAYATQRARRTGARQLVKRSFPTHTNELAKMYDVQAWR